MKKFFVTALAGAVAAGAGIYASATSLIRLDLNAMVDESSAVFVGQAIDQRSTETENGLYTMTTFAVSDAVVGDAGSTITVATPGGVRINGKYKIAETWPGAPRFIRGQEMLMFVTGDEAGAGKQVVGFSQGALPVMNTAEGKAVRLPDGTGKMTSLSEAKTKIRAAYRTRGQHRKRKDISED